MKIADYTTLKIGGEAETVYFPSSTDELILIRDFLVLNNKEITVIGAGSNILVSSNSVSGGVILTNNLKNCEIFDTDKVKADCGVKSAKLAKILSENNLSGLEFLIGIPGSVGGAVAMNSSAHNQAVKDTIESAEVMNLETGEIFNLDKSQLKLDYRSSFVEAHKYLILNATFQLKKAEQKNILEKMEYNLNYRKQNHPPMTESNAGSCFRNPVNGVYVGYLLEKLGAKNWSQGKAKISSKHANFIVNTGDATSLDVSRLMYKMYTEIKNNFGYELVAEIKYIGNSTEEEKEIWKNITKH
ncbi:MAG: UDP-N-acetylmuramate dehydrogenase [bacterium]